MIRIQYVTTNRLHRGVIAAVIAGATAFAVAEQVTVHRDIDVVADKNPLADTVETVPTDTKLDVVNRDGSWVRVRTPAGKEGYVTADDVAGVTSLSGATGNTNVNGLNVTAASKGLKDDAEKYARQKNLKTDGVNTMYAWGDSVSKKDLRDFAKAGHVGNSKFRDKK